MQNHPKARRPNLENEQQKKQGKSKDLATGTTIKFLQELSGLT